MSDVSAHRDDEQEIGGWKTEFHETIFSTTLTAFLF
jgi:hypothetical protein